MILQEYPCRETLFDGITAAVLQQLSTALGMGPATLAVPGGSTPGPMFDRLACADLKWPDTRVLLTDERWVPPDHERSNTRLLMDRLLVARAANANYVLLYNGAPTAEIGATEVSQAVEPCLPISVLVLGMGTDMHCASLFPGAPELAAAQAEDAPAVLALQPGDGLEPRVTLTARVLATAINTHVLIIGDEKKAALEKAMILDPARAPISQFLPQAQVHWAPE